MPKTAAVTGATGFVGKHLIAELTANDYRINALTRSPRPESGNITWISGDLADERALARLIEDADVVFHLAGLIKATSRQEFMAVNCDAVRRLARIIDQSRVNPHFILLSSLAARERHLSSYAHSKRRGEENLLEYTRDMSSNWPWTILRPPGIYGPYDRETLKIFKAVAHKIAPLPGASDNRASWIFGPDLARAMLSVAGNSECYGKILDVDDGTPEGYSIQEMYETAAEILNIRPFHFTVPKSVLKTAAHSNVLFSTIFGYTPMITPGKINELCHPDWICRGPHVMKMTSWKPQTNLKQGFQKTLNWYKENKMV